MCIEALESLSISSGTLVEISLYDICRGLYDDNDDVVVRIDLSLFKNSIDRSILSKLDDFWKKLIHNANINSDQIKHVLLTGGSAEVPHILYLFKNNNVMTFCCKHNLLYQKEKWQLVLCIISKVM